MCSIRWSHFYVIFSLSPRCSLLFPLYLLRNYSVLTEASCPKGNIQNIKNYTKTSKILDSLWNNQQRGHFVGIKRQQQQQKQYQSYLAFSWVSNSSHILQSNTHTPGKPEPAYQLFSLLFLPRTFTSLIFTWVADFILQASPQRTSP